MGCCGSREEDRERRKGRRRHRGDEEKAYTTEELIIEKRLSKATKGSGELTREDRELLKTLLKDLQAPADIKVKCEGDDGKAVPLHFDMKNRLLIEGIGAKSRRIPYIALRNVQYGERNGHQCFQIDFEVPLPGESGSATYFMAKDSDWTAEAISVEVREIIDAVSQDNYPLANFGVIKINPQGKHQARLLQIDIPNRLLSNVHKGEIKSQFHFSDIVNVQEDPDAPSFTLFFQNYRPYPIVAQSSEDAAVLLKILKQISIGAYTVSNLTHHDLAIIPFWPAAAVHAAPMQKKGELHWDDRYAVLTSSRLFIFRQRGSRNPLNVITLLGTEVQRGSDDLEIVLAMASRDFRLRCESAKARDKWYTALRGAISRASGYYTDYISSVFSRANEITGGGGGGSSPGRKSSSRGGGGGGGGGRGGGGGGSSGRDHHDHHRV
jgi:hypothetical protein